MTSMSNHETVQTTRGGEPRRIQRSPGEIRVAAQINWYANSRLGKPTSQCVQHLAGEPTRWRRRWFKKLPEWDD